MTRIQNKPKGLQVHLKDKVLTTNYPDNISENYDVEQLMKFLNQFYKGEGLSFIYAHSSNPNDETVDTYFNFDVENLASVTEININKTSINGIVVDSFINQINTFLTDQKFNIKVQSTQNEASFFYFEINTITDNTTHFTLGISRASDQISGTLENNISYILSIDPASEGGGELNRPISDSVVSQSSTTSASSKAAFDAYNYADIAQGNATVALQLILNQAASGGGQEFRGEWDPATTNLFPEIAQTWTKVGEVLTEVKAGFMYKATSSATIDGQLINVDDLIFALVDDPSNNTFSGNWAIISKAEAESGYSNITWENLRDEVGLTREPDQKYNITGSADSSKDYGKITLLSANNFWWTDSNNEINNIIII